MISYAWLKDLPFRIGIGAMVGGTILMYTTFYYAYFNGYEALITINDFGEAKFEFWFFTALLPFIFWTCFKLMEEK